MRERFELIFVAVFAGFTADVVCGTNACWFGLIRTNGLGRAARGAPTNARQQQTGKQQRLSEYMKTQLSGSSKLAELSAALGARNCRNVSLLTRPVSKHFSPLWGAHHVA